MSLVLKLAKKHEEFYIGEDLIRIGSGTEVSLVKDGEVIGTGFFIPEVTEEIVRVLEDALVEAIAESGIPDRDHFEWTADMLSGHHLKYLLETELSYLSQKHDFLSLRGLYNVMHVIQCVTYNSKVDRFLGILSVFVDELRKFKHEKNPPYRSLDAHRVHRDSHIIDWDLELFRARATVALRRFPHGHNMGIW